MVLKCLPLSFSILHVTKRKTYEVVTLTHMSLFQKTWLGFLVSRVGSKEENGNILESWWSSNTLFSCVHSPLERTPLKQRGLHNRRCKTRRRRTKKRGRKEKWKKKGENGPLVILVVPHFVCQPWENFNICLKTTISCGLLRGYQLGLVCNHSPSWTETTSSCFPK